MIASYFQRAFLYVLACGLMYNIVTLYDGLVVTIGSPWLC
jgi:hypothetical protein